MTVYVITGGLGSFGSAMTRYLLDNTSHSIRVLDRSEDKMLRAMDTLPPSSRLTYILADIRDKDRLTSAFYGATVIFHAAALKQVPMGELHTGEFFKTNVIGTQNVIDAAIANHSTITNVLLISSDKACMAFNAYGKTKALAEALITVSNTHSHGIKLSSVRGGNIWNSRGSVIDKWLHSTGSITLYNPATTRFHLTMREWLRFCLVASEQTHGGEIFIPKCDAWNLGDLAIAFQAVYPDRGIEIKSNGRHGDKITETLVSEYEFVNAKDLGWGYVVEPSPELRSVWRYDNHAGRAMRDYLSSDNVRHLAVDELRSLIHKETTNA